MHHPFHARPTGRAILAGSCVERRRLGACAPHLRCSCALARGAAAGPRCRGAAGAPAWPRTHTEGCNELRPRSSKTQEGLGGEPSLEGHPPRLYGGGRRSAARLGAHRAHARAARRRKAVEAHPRRAVREHARRADRQPGAAAGEGRAQGDLSVRAGRSRPTRTSPARCIPDQSLYPANSVPMVVRRINNTFQRADQIQHMEGTRRHRLLRADRRRRGGRDSAACSMPSSS